MTKIISAGAGERMQHLTHKYNDTTIRFLLHYPEILQEEILCEATRAIIDKVDVLHASFVTNTQTCHWSVNKKYQNADFFRVVECEGDPFKVAMGLAIEPVRYKDKCQLQVTLVKGSKSSTVLIRISHLVVDGSDGKYLLNKLAECYRWIESGKNTTDVEVKNGSRSAMNAYRELGIRDISALMKMPFHGVKTNYPFTNPGEHGMLRMLRCTVPADILSKARVKAKMEGATVNDLLLTACYCSYAKTTEKEGAMSIAGMMDLRQHCAEGTSEGLSNMSGGLSTTLNYERKNTFSENLSNIVLQTKAVKENPLAGLDGMPLMHTATKTVPMWILLQIANIIYSNMSLSMTNLGNISCESLAMRGVKPTEGVFGGPLKYKPSLQVGVASFDGTAELSILGDFATEDLDMLQCFLEGIRKEIEDYIKEEH